MRILKHKTNIDFIGKRRTAFFISTLINLAILVGIATVGFDYGVDFAGGTLVELKFHQPMTPQQVRERAAPLGDPHVQRIGSEADNSFLVRLGGVTQLTEESRDKAQAALAPLGLERFDAQLDSGLINMRMRTQVDPQAIRQAVESTGTGVSEVRSLGEAQGGGFDYQVVASGMADRIVQVMSAHGEKDFTVQRVDYVGPQIGRQLRNKGVLALLYAMVAILVYVAFRFDFKFGPGALLAMLHDLIMVAGYYLVTRREFNLTSIAVLLTIVGYSVNDTIVIYDRIREEMVKHKGKALPELINLAVNDTLSRTILTGSVTALSLVGLLIFGVGEIFDFAAAMLVGIAVGTYSSIYIASPVTIWLDERAAAKARATGGRGMKAKVA
ncbi:MAG: protein translocase subunit SecF [Myxococcaceae bacterium]|nr:protein translocase subunit SecF [Myxococcaceae bacterium]MCI0673664.1 protein translocase subunit SecF [Myxococcaceae bacterium]